jgi:hypothetical protein
MGNENQLMDITVIIKDLMTRRAALDAAITNLITASGAMVAGDISVPALQNGADSQPVELPRGAFIGKSLPAAVKLYLSAMKKNQPLKEIVAALRDGGVETTSDDFEGVITGCLNRMKNSGEVLRFSDGWALAEFYPENLRNRLAQQNVVKRKTGKRPKKAKKTAKSLDKTPSEQQTNAPVEGLKHVLEAYARSRAGEWFSYLDAAQTVPTVNAKVVALTLGRLAKDFSWEKDAAGRYRAFADNVKEMPKAV